MRRWLALALVLGGIGALPSQADSLLSEEVGDLYSRRPYQVGELVTVQILEDVSVVETVNRRSSNALEMSGGASGVLPGLVGDAVGLTGGLVNAVGVEGDLNDVRRDSSTAIQSVSHTLTAQVVEVQGDVLTLEATKHSRLDGIRRRITLRGKVRRQDIEDGNRIASTRMADLDLYADGLKVSPSSGGLITWFLGLLR